jgi:hypothetical protein
LEWLDVRYALCDQQDRYQFLGAALLAVAQVDPEGLERHRAGASLLFEHLQQRDLQLRATFDGMIAASKPSRGHRQ